MLRRAQQKYPADFWVNYHLGMALQTLTPPKLEEAVRFLTAALALRPESVGVHLNLGNALARQGQVTPQTVAQAIERYGVGTQSAAPWTQ